MLFNLLKKKVFIMNTLDNKLTALMQVLQTNKPALKIDDSLTTALKAWIAITEVHYKISNEVMSSFVKACTSKFLVPDSQILGLIHVPASQLYAGMKTARELKPAHDVHLNLSTETEYRLATDLLNSYSRQTTTDTKTELHYPAYALECLHLINGNTTLVDLKGERSVTLKSDSFDYESLGLDAAWFHSGKGAVYTSEAGTRHIIKPEYISVAVAFVFAHLDIFSMETKNSTVEAYEGMMVTTKPQKKRNLVQDIAKQALSDINFEL
jgi:hypothetical protein